MSSRKGYGLFARDKRALVRLLTVGLFSLGVLAASILVYQELTKPAKPSLISEDEAVNVAAPASNLQEKALRNMKTDVTLIHVKENGFTFVVDQGTLQDTLNLDGHIFPGYEGHYLRIVRFTGTGDMASSHWETIVDATSSEVLMQG